ncbi:MAG: hypothetical protein VKK80_09160, partial [Prochlorothrix sp.]|nr:hypothetical protein [Prochlorothrix sp.]
LKTEPCKPVTACLAVPTLDEVEAIAGLCCKLLIKPWPTSGDRSLHIKKCCVFGAWGDFEKVLWHDADGLKQMV